MIRTSVEPEFDPTNTDVYFTCRVRLTRTDGELIAEEMATCDNMEQSEFVLERLCEQVLATDEPAHAARMAALVLVALRHRGMRADHIANAIGQRIAHVEVALSELRKVGLVTLDGEGTWTALRLSPDIGAEAILFHLLISITTVCALAALVFIDLGWL